MRANNGSTSARTDATTDPTSSPVDTMKLPSPRVVVVEIPRTITVPVWTSAAVPPPAMMARVQVSNGDSSVIDAAVSRTPAITAAGVVMVSSTLSSKGT